MLTATHTSIDLGRIYTSSCAQIKRTKEGTGRCVGKTEETVVDLHKRQPCACWVTATYARGGPAHFVFDILVEETKARLYPL